MSYPRVGPKFTVSKINYSYNWYYDSSANGWKWRRVRQNSQILDHGLVNNKSLLIKTQLGWGAYDLIVEDINGSKTVYEFYIGWGSDGKTSAQPEKLEIFMEEPTKDHMSIRFEAPFSGIASINFVDDDVFWSKDYNVSKGSNELNIEKPNNKEPGFHILAALKRPITSGSEPLPQIALGAFWVESLNDNREIQVSIETSKKRITSMDPISIKIIANRKNASAIVFVVDEGIHDLTNFNNPDPLKHFYTERELPIGILSNYGQLIKQDKTLKTLQVGGDYVSAPGISKSDFFKTIAYSSKVINLINGEATVTIPSTDFEGKIRIVALVADSKGLGFNESFITIEDQVSLDISLPRFVAVNDQVLAKLGVRINEKVGNLIISKTIEANTNGIELLLNKGQSFKSDIVLNPTRVGRIPVSIQAKYNNGNIIRNFEIVSRSPTYPHTELVGLNLKTADSTDNGITLIPPLKSINFDIQNQKDLDISFSLSDSPGVNITQVLSSLDRYPYGCIEQTSSTTRGLIFREKIKNKTDKSQIFKINIGLDKIIAKQKSNGDFGYWNKFDRTYEQYQPYAVETLILGYEFADNKQSVLRAIELGLQHLSSHNFEQVENELYSLGILRKSGFEVTSRIRYVIDQKVIKFYENQNKYKPSAHEGYLGKAALGYWLADLINDESRLTQLHKVLTKNISNQRQHKKEKSEINWGNINTFSILHDNAIVPRNATFLAEVSDPNKTELILELINSTRMYMMGLKYTGQLLIMQIWLIFCLIKQIQQRTWMY